MTGFCDIKRQTSRSARRGSGMCNSKDIGMGSCVKQKECQLCIVLLPELIGLLKTPGVVNRVLHASNCAIRSSTLLASYTRPASTSSNACSMPLLRGFRMIHPILRERLRAKRTSLRGRGSTGHLRSLRSCF